MNEHKQFFIRHKVTLILPYFGQLPNYFDLWIQSVRKCENIRFIVCGDCLPREGNEGNIYFLKKSFDWIRQRINSVLGFKCTLNTPYKLCDYKPTYGLVFSEYLEGSEYWGYCDPDLIFGTKLEECVRYAISKQFDKIYKYGHLTLYKNEKAINTHFMKRSKVEKVTYKDVYRMNYVAHFDEGYIIRDLFSVYKVYDEIDFSDVSFWKYQFQTEGYQDYKQIFEYNDGRLFIHYIDENGEQRKSEKIYVHLQKRRMQKEFETANRYLIVPNRFIRIDSDFTVSKDVIEMYSIENKSYELAVKKRRIKSVVQHCLTGAIRYRMINRFRK